MQNTAHAKAHIHSLRRRRRRRQDDAPLDINPQSIISMCLRALSISKIIQFSLVSGTRQSLLLRQ